MSAAVHSCVSYSVFHVCWGRGTCLGHWQRKLADCSKKAGTGARTHTTHATHRMYKGAHHTGGDEIPLNPDTGVGVARGAFASKHTVG